MQNIALAWLVIELTSSPVAVGILAFCRFVPFTVFGLFAGVVADRVENRKLVIGTQLVSMLLSAILTVVVLTGSATLWLVYVLAALGGCALVFDAPGRHALTFQLVGRDELSNAVALNASLFNASRVVGPSLAGVLIAAFGVGACFAINTVSFLAVLTSLLLMRQEELVPVKRDAEPPSMLRSIGEGLRYARVTPRGAADPRDRHRRQHRRLQLPRDPAAPRLGDAGHRTRGLRDPVRLLRRRRARRRAADAPRSAGRAGRSSSPGPAASASRCSRSPRSRTSGPARSSSSSPAPASRSGRRTRTRSSSSARPITCAAASSASSSGPSPGSLRSAASSPATSPLSAERSSHSSSPEPPGS